jgi:DNA replication protein DnaC
MGSRIAEGYQDIQAQTHEEFLEKILRMEVKAREVNRKNLLLKQANFDVIKTFEGYLFDAIQIPNSIGIETIKEAAFVEQKENLILYGSVGTGNYRKFLFMARNKDICLFLV